MRKALITLGFIALAALFYALYSWLQAHALITFVDDSWEIKTGEVKNGFSLLYQAAPLALFFAAISFITAGLLGLFFTDKATLVELEALRNHVEEAKERVNKAEYNARKEVERELEESLTSAQKRDETLKKGESELKEKITLVKNLKQKIDEEAQQKIDAAEAQYKQEIDKKTKAMAYAERKQKRLNKLKERIENNEEVTTEDVLKIIS
ncbi:MAG: hypothetical protein WC340_18210 [Kiritimatiellia bacterium]|jgi:hypothetical protein